MLRLSPRILILCSVVASCPASTWALDQAESQKAANQINNQGSDDSLKGSVNNGLKAADSLYSLDFPSAISHGVKAYGQYRNSEQLDTLKEKNEKLKASLGAVGSSGVSGATENKSGAYVSPYQRLDRKFLYEGETGQLAAKAEKIFGMSRDSLYQHAVNIHTNSKSIFDPDFIPWASKTYRGLVEQATDPELKAKLGKIGDKGEALAKTGVGLQMIAKAWSLFGSGEAASTISEKANDAGAVAQTNFVVSPTGNETAGASGGESGSAPAASSATPATAESPTYKPGFERVALDPVDPFLGKLMKESENNQSLTIFQQVSNKIRDVSVKQRMQSVAK